MHDKDEYDVEAYNLVTLKDSMAKYATLSNDDFVPTGDAQLDAIERFFREAEVGITVADNFRAGVEVEEYENDSLYSGFSKVARGSRCRRAPRSPRLRLERRETSCSLRRARPGYRTSRRTRRCMTR